MSKVCSCCGLTLELTEFYKQVAGKDGYNSQCKSCIKKSVKRYRENNKDKIKKLKRKQYEEKLNPSVYVLLVNSSVVYVGSSVNPTFRKAKHKSRAKNFNNNSTKHNKDLYSYLNKNEFEFKIISSYKDIKTARKAELFFMNLFSRHNKLFNKKRG
jgi:predicted GIY-YIG superfamily endonuclease